VEVATTLKTATIGHIISETAVAKNGTMEFLRGSMVGPKSGDVEAVRQMGLEKWVETGLGKASRRVSGAAWTPAGRPRGA
jgi:hypothetical protein